MTQQLQYPLLNNVRHGYSSVELKMAGQRFIGVKSANYSRTRNRELIRGMHPDPLAKTRGENEYSADVELYLAEFMLFLAILKGQQTPQAGYGDVFFDMYCTYGENGFDTFTDEITGCTLDTTEIGLSQGPDALVRKFELNPLKVKLAGADDLEYALQPPV